MTLSKTDLVAPPDYFRLVFVDTFDEDAFVVDDYNTIDAAILNAKKREGVMSKCYVYDDNGI